MHRSVGLLASSVDIDFVVDQSQNPFMGSFGGCEEERSEAVRVD